MSLLSVYAYEYHKWYIYDIPETIEHSMMKRYYGKSWINTTKSLAGLAVGGGSHNSNIILYIVICLYINKYTYVNYTG